MRPNALLLSLAALALIGCPTGDDGFPRTGTESGGVEGSICAPNGQDSVSGAQISLFEDADEDLIADTETAAGTTVTDADGVWVFDGLAAGAYVAELTRGHHELTFPVVFAAGNRAILNEECLAPDELSIIEVAGGCDAPGSVYEDLGFTVDTLSSSDTEWRDLITNANDIDSVDILLLPCGLPEHWVPQAQTVQTVVTGWLEDGGSLYISGNSWPILEAIDADAVDFLRDDTDFDAPEVGFGSTPDAAVIDTELAAHFPSGLASIRLPDEWVVMESAGDDSGVMLSANVQTLDFESVDGAPLLIKNETSDRGPIVYSSFGITGESNADMDRVMREILLAL